MPEYLAPGVYVEEVSFRSKSIEGVGTTTSGFVGPTRYGPTDLEPEIITSLNDFERIYGDGQQLNYADQPKAIDNYMWHAVRAFFQEGGKRLYVARTFREKRAEDDPNKIIDDGCADAMVPRDAAKLTPAPTDPDKDTVEAQYPGAIHIKARFPGQLGNMRLRFTVSLGQNLLGIDQNNRTTARALQDYDVVWFRDVTGSTFSSPLQTRLGRPLSSPLDLTLQTEGRFFYALQEDDPNTKTKTWYFRDENDQKYFELADFDGQPGGDELRVVALTLTVFPTDPFDLPQVWTGLPLGPGHKQIGSGAPDALSDVFAKHPANRAQAYRLPIIITLGKNLKNGVDVLNALDQDWKLSRRGPSPSAPATPYGSLLEAVRDLVLGIHKSTDDERSFDIVLEGGNDGIRPSAAEYEGKADEKSSTKTGLKAFEDTEDISILAAPGSTFLLEDGYHADAMTIIGNLISHAERMRYRIAVLDSGDGQTIAQVRAMRAKLDSKYAALYYPWVRVLDPITRKEIYLPPSGFVAGIYARNDINRAVYKAPANEVVNLALGFEITLNKSQQEVLNPEGINCFRFFEGRGNRLWGARTISSDPEWKYVNLRRYFGYLERSIDKGTQWAVFEPNGEALWANVRRTIEDFLLNEWMMGALLGDKPEKAYFVRCDRSTMTQNDLDNGRLVCLIGVAALRPAEFVIFRIGQWTADRKV